LVEVKNESCVALAGYGPAVVPLVFPNDAGGVGETESESPEAAPVESTSEILESCPVYILFHPLAVV
jgi:hypothetical protein